MSEQTVGSIDVLRTCVVFLGRDDTEKKMRDCEKEVADFQRQPISKLGLHGASQVMGQADAVMETTDKDPVVLFKAICHGIPARMNRP